MNKKIISENSIKKKKGTDVESNKTGTYSAGTSEWSGKKARQEKSHSAGNSGKDSLFHFMDNEKFREVK